MKCKEQISSAGQDQLIQLKMN